MVLSTSASGEAKVKVKKSVKRLGAAVLGQLYLFLPVAARRTSEAPEAHEVCLSVPVLGELGVQVEWGKGATRGGETQGLLAALAARQEKKKKKKKNKKSEGGKRAADRLWSHLPMNKALGRCQLSLASRCALTGGSEARPSQGAREVGAEVPDPARDKGRKGAT